jgi:hypothetical protein
MVLSADSSMTSGLWMPLLAFLGVALLLIQLRRRQFRTTGGRDVTRAQSTRLRDQRGVQQAMDQLLLQLEELSRRINAQVDTKFLKLEMVIRDADDRIARLEGLLGKPKQPGTRTAGGVKAPEPKPASVPGDGSRPTTASARASVAPPGPSTPPAMASTSPGRTGDASEPAKPVMPTDPRVGRVHALADAGQQPIKIAEELDMPLGEVEFILNLRDFR